MSIALGQCHHFRGIQHARCAVGVLLSSVKGDNPTGVPFRAAWACVPEGAHIPCIHRQMPTPAEIAADIAAAPTELARLLLEARAERDEARAERDTLRARLVRIAFRFRDMGHLSVMCELDDIRRAADERAKSPTNDEEER